LGTLLVVYGFWIEPHRIQVTHQKLVSRKLPSGFRLKILHLGDLHIERITDRERQLNQSIRELQPDLILFSGDFLNLSYLKDPSAWQAMCQVVSEWQAPLGVFSVSGSPAVDLEDVIPSQLKGLPIVHLPANRMTLQHQGQSLDLIGLGCTHKPHQDFPLLKELMDGHPDRFTILLYHSPDLAPEAAQTNIDLQLSGHTHGGQVRLPIFGALFTGSLYGKKFEAGRMQINDMALYITRGIGLEGASAPRVRFLCPPEIILWDITGIGSNS
jgi:predicted MPP superfamily phosphohydrolase